MLEAQLLRDQYNDNLTAKQGVVGVGIGQKWASGVPIENQPAIIVFVEKKYTKRSVTRKYSIDDIIPDHLDGIPTDVIEVGKLVKHNFNFRQRLRPIKPGLSCGQGDITAGTIGGFFLDSDNQPVILSNCHVLANENRAKIGDPIYQPGPADFVGTNMVFRGWPDPVSALPYIATLKKFVTLKKTDNVQDSAIALIHPSIISSGLVDYLYPVINKGCSGFGVAAPGQQVQKCGRTTGYTTGRVIATKASFTIGYDFGQARFNDCVVLSSMSKPGDSGSVIYDMGMKAVAHLFAGSNKVTIANPIEYVVNTYGLKPWSPIGAGVDTLDFSDTTWKQVTSTGGKITMNNNTVTIEAAANQFCFIESAVVDFNSVSVDVNTGTDKGASWGPSLTVQWPTGILKVNLRHGDRFGGYFNGTYNISIGTVKPNSNYTLRIRKSTAETYVGEVLDGDKWYTVIELPCTIFPHKPTAVRVGKTDEIGQPSSYTTIGDIGTCVFTNFVQN